MTWRLGPGDRVGLVGVNGAGKTSALRLLSGDLEPDAGRVRRGRTVALAHLTQDVTPVDPELRVLASVEEVRRVTRTADGEITATSMLERFGFTGDRLTTRVGDLSGGERRRLQILRLLLDEPNVLLLDEPTNDLDIETLTVLEDFLDGWPGTLVVVSHDRYFLERTCDTVWALLGDGSLVMLPRGVEEYLERRRATVAVRPARAAPVRAPGPVPGRRGAGGRGAAESREARKSMQRLERQLAKLQAEEKRLHDQLAAHAHDFERLADPGRRAARAWSRDARPSRRSGSRSPRSPRAERGRSASAGVSSCSIRVSSDPQRVGQGAVVLGAQGGEQLALLAQQQREGAVDPVAALVGEPHADAPTVLRGRTAGDQAAGGEPVDPVGHGAAGHQGLAEQLPGGELVGRAGASQRGQHVELPQLEALVGEGAAARDVEVVAQPADPAQHLHGGQVEVRALALPGRDQAVDVIVMAPG